MEGLLFARVLPAVVVRPEGTCTTQPCLRFSKIALPCGTPNIPLVSQCSNGFVLGGLHFLDPLGGLSAASDSKSVFGIS